MRTVVAEFNAVPPDQVKPKEELTLQQERASRKKYGRLSVLYLHKKQQNRRQRVDCICECGRIVTRDWVGVYTGKIKNCGSKDCMWSRIDAAKQYEKFKNKTPAIVAKLKPKWYCSRPEEACVWSATCNICCCECDKKNCQKRCLNSPDKCCGSRRREKNER